MSSQRKSLAGVHGEHKIIACHYREGENTESLEFLNSTASLFISPNPRESQSSEHMSITSILRICAFVPSPVETAFVVVSIKRKIKSPLVKVRLAGNRLSLLLNPLQRRHQNRHQQSIDSNHNQKLYQCKASWFMHNAKSYQSGIGEPPGQLNLKVLPAGYAETRST